MKLHRAAVVAWCALAIAAPPPPWSLLDTIKHHLRAVITTTTATTAAPRIPAHAATRHGGDLVLRFTISTAAESARLAEAADTLMLDVWEAAHDWVDVRLATNSVPLLLSLLPDSLQHAHKPLMGERQLADAIIANYAHEDHPQRPFTAHLNHTSGPETNIFFADYQPFSVIEPWLRLMASLFPTHVTHLDIGRSYEGRSIPALRVGVHPTTAGDPHPPRRKTILVVGSLHAREWISTTTVNYIAYSFITAYGNDHSMTRMLDNFDFVFIPTLNPDGYVYTWETDRLWRKNRQQTGIRFCQGMDLDRSFGFAWSATDNPCSESYTGEAPFQAVEAKHLADWAQNETKHNNVDFVGFLDLHSYSQEVLYPYSYSCDDQPPGLENLEELAMGLAKSIRTTHGRNYEVMSACEGNSVVTADGKKVHLRPSVEPTGGSALDFFYRTMGVRYAYQLKLRDRGTYGFLLPKEHIVPTGTETLNAVLYFASFLDDLYAREMKEKIKAASHFTEDEWKIIDMVDRGRDGLLTEADLDALRAEQDNFKHDLKRRRRK